MVKRVALVVAGCGQRDGSEIHETVLALLGVVQAGAEPLFYAPNALQARVFDHAAQQSVKESRNMLVEAARIARGKISDLKKLTTTAADAVIFPGGAGASWNLSDFAEKGASFAVQAEAQRVIKEFFLARKPLGFICIAPVLAAKVLGSQGIEVTVGDDPETIKVLEQLGAKHVVKTAAQYHVDYQHKVVTTPAYMSGKNIGEIETGILGLAKAVVELA